MVIQIILHTPVWVYFLLIALLYLGYMQTKTRNISVFRLFMLPVVLGCFSLFGVFSGFDFQVMAIAAWFSGVVLAFLFVGLFKLSFNSTYDSFKNQYTVSGSWVPMMLILVMFFARYTVTVCLMLNTYLAWNNFFVSIVSLFYGFVSGIFMARAWHIFTRKNM